MKRPVIILILLLCHNILLGQQPRLRVDFVVYTPQNTPKAANIFISGSFNNWHPGNDNWVLVHTGLNSYNRMFFFNPGFYEYKITRGNWLTVECTAKGACVEKHALHIVSDTTIVINIAQWKDIKPVIQN